MSFHSKRQKLQEISAKLGSILCVLQEIDGTYVQLRSQCIEGVTFTCNGTQDNNCNDGDATVREWQIAFYNFDNMASALLSVVEVAVMDNYMDDCAYFLMDATGFAFCLNLCNAAGHNQSPHHRRT